MCVVQRATHFNKHFNEDFIFTKARKDTSSIEYFPSIQPNDQLQYSMAKEHVQKVYPPTHISGTSALAIYI